MSALSAAASDEDGETIRNLKAQMGRANALCRIRLDRIRELEAMLYAVGAGGVGKAEQPDTALPASVPTGWQLVSVEPTPEMVEAIVAYSGKCFTDAFDRDDFLVDYRAMLAAAPQPPVVKQEPVAWADLKAWESERYDAHDVFSGSSVQGWTPLYTHPQNLLCKSNQARLATLWGYVKEQPQVEQEPVAWMYDWDADGAPVRDWVSRDYGEAHSPTNGCHNIRPLYTHPQNLNCKSNQARLATLWGYVKEQPQPQSGGIPPDWKRRLGNLLAVIHGDGGHYIDAHGWEKAQADAEKKIAKVMTDSAQSKPVAYRHLHEDGWEYYDAPTGSDCDDCQALYTHPQPPVVEQEPVAWMWSSGGNKSSLTFGGPNSNTPKDWDVQPLYTHPQPLQPLTDEEIGKLAGHGYNGFAQQALYDFRAFARAIERAHGIGGEA